jgi:hypothetical protein
MIEDILVIDNLFTLEQQDNLKDLFLNSLFPWYYKSTLSQNTKKTNFDSAVAPGFGHVFYNDNGIVSEYFDAIASIPKVATTNTPFVFNKLIYARTFLQMPLTTTHGITNPHIDVAGLDHSVCIYYVDDADGETVIFDKTSQHDPVDFTGMRILQTISPRKGRIVLFDGARYHANILPQRGPRCIINFDFI